MPVFLIKMIHRIRHISLALIAALAVTVSLCACSQAGGTDDAGSMPSAPAATLAFVISTGDTQDQAGAPAASSLSKAIPADGPYDPGTGFENYIHIEAEPSDIAVYLFDGDGRFLFQATDPRLVRLNSYPSAKSYELYFSVQQADKDRIDRQNIKVVLLANWRDYPSLSAGNTVADLVAASEAVMDYSPVGLIASAADRIPLFGVIHIDRLSLLPSGNTTWLGTLHLLRSLAKVTVTDADLLAGVGDGLKIQSVELARYNTRTVKAPSGVTHQDQYVKGSYAKDYLDWVTVADGAEAAIPLAFAEISAGVFQIYCPEYPNIGRGDAQRSRIRVTYNDNEAFYIDFKYYSGPSKNSAFDVCRNNWYQFDVMRSKASINCEVQVIPYSIIELNPGFGVSIDRPLVPIRNDNGQLEYWYDPETGKFYGLDKKTEIPNPNFSSDPINGWVLMRDENSQFVCYNDQVSGRFYGWDRTTEIADPFETDPQGTGWLIIQNPEKTRVYYYYHRSSSTWYLPDKTTKVERPFDNKSEIS